ncbi:MAG: hypothetical protein H7A35_13730 [Planctomycetales bacterium]|nr:MAG: hypothetical protein H7A35_13730 [Planctomycetales bacterium]
MTRDRELLTFLAELTDGRIRAVRGDHRGYVRLVPASPKRISYYFLEKFTHRAALKNDLRESGANISEELLATTAAAHHGCVGGRDHVNWRRRRIRPACASSCDECQIHKARWDTRPVEFHAQSLYFYSSL